MSNDIRNGLQITPLTLWVAGGLGAALWGVLFAQGMRTQDKQDKVADSVTALVTAKEYDRREIDAIKGDVRSVQTAVGEISQRLGKVEARK